MQRGLNARDNVRTTRHFQGGFGGDSLIRTPCGARRADMVRPDDLIVTQNGLKPVKLVLKRRVSRADTAAGNERTPIRLRRRAIGPMLPERDVLLSPDHRAVLPGYRLVGTQDNETALLPIGEVADHSDHAFRDRSAFGAELFTFVFEEPQVFRVSGLLVESFCPNESTLSALTGRMRAELVRLFPDLRKDLRAYPTLALPVADSYCAGPEGVGV